MENYSNSVECTGDAQQILAAVSTVLITNGFSVVKQEHRQIEFAGPGMNSTKQNPLVGASEVIVHVDQGRLTVVAELGGVAKMQRFLIRFPLLLGLGLGLGLGTLSLIFIACFQFWGGNPAARFPLFWLYPALVFTIPVLAVSPWFFLSPWMGAKLQKRTTAALDTLLANISQVASIA